MYPGASKNHIHAIMTPLYMLGPCVPPLLKVLNTENMLYTGREQSGDGSGLVVTTVIEFATSFLAFKGVYIKINVVVYVRQ